MVPSLSERPGRRRTISSRSRLRNEWVTTAPSGVRLVLASGHGTADDARRYAFLVGTAEGAALRAAHECAFGVLCAADRATVVAAVQDHTLAGIRLTPDDLPALARLVVAADAGVRVGARVAAHRPPGEAPRHRRRGHAVGRDRVCRVGATRGRGGRRGAPTDRGWDSIDDNQVYRFTHHSQEVIGGSQAVFSRRRG